EVIMSMDRRRFVQLAGGLAAVCAAGRSLPSFACANNTRPLTTADYRLMRRFAAMECGRVAYLDRGKGRVALFLHGFPLNSYQWRGLIARVQHQRRCITPDFLGLGYTEVNSGQSITPKAQATMLAALLDRLSIQEVDLVANDSGG